ncbi:MAG TPA: hypothetical protein VMV72_07720 [Verrucomicrobiae bacterium]|nr:hypothetical protein [Verrucomicrobiae bacterium]
MTEFAASVDTGSKRWLAILAIAVAAAIVVMAYSFIATSSPPEPAVVAPSKPAPPPADQTVARTEPDWNSAPAARASQAARPDPFATQYASEARNAAAHDPVAHEQAVHRQADYLRDQIAKGKLSQGLGNLTKEKVDDMEKKGILIE